MEKDKLREIKTENGITVFKYGETFIKVKPVKFPEEIDPDRITKIDLNHLIAEIVTIPVLVNRFGTLMTELDAEFKEEKLKFEIFCAKQKEEIRNKLMSDNAKKPTIDEVETALILLPAYKVMKTKLIKSEKNYEMTKNIYWSVKDKSDKLDKLSLTIQREDLDGLEAMLHNGVKITSRKFSDE